MTRRLSWAAVAVATLCATLASGQVDHAKVDPLIREFRGQDKAIERSAEEQQKAYELVLDALLPDLGNPGNDGNVVNARQNAETTVQDIALRASRPGAEKERLALVKALLAKLPTTTDWFARTWLIREVQWTGKAEAVPALVGLLADADARIADSARRALLKNPSDDARDALRSGLAKAGTPAQQIAFVNALSQRFDTGSVAAIAKLLSAADAAVAVAAARALGELATPDALTALGAARGAVPAAQRAQFDDAWLQAADKLVAAKNLTAAAKAYEAAWDAKETKRVRAAGLRGLALTRGAAALPTLVSAAKGDDWFLATSALRALLLVPGAAATQAFADLVAGLGPDMAVQTLRTLAERGDKSAAPQVLAATKAGEENVRVAAITALIKLGDKSCVAVLAEIIGKNGGNLEAAVRQTLAQLPGEAVDLAILDQLSANEGKIRDEMVRALSARRSATAVPALVKVAASDPHEGVKVIALDALAVLADPRQYTALVGVLVKADTDKFRAAAENAVAKTEAAVPDAGDRAKPLLAALPPATGATRLALLRLLGQTGAANALETLRAATKDGDKAVQGAAITGLAAWPTAEPLDDLLAWVKADGAERDAALAGYLRQINLTKLSAEQRAKLFADAKPLCKRKDEQRLLVLGLADVPCLDALKQLSAAVDEGPFFDEAGAGIIKVGTALRGSNPDEVRAAIAAARDMVRDRRIVGELSKLAALVSKGLDAVVAWLVSPAYQLPGKTGLELTDVVFDAEKPDNTVKWTLVNGAADAGGTVTFDGTPVAGDNKCIYAKAQIYAPQAMDIELQCGSDDGLKVWLNGEVIHTHRSDRGMTAGEDHVKAKLKEGWNPVLVKVTNDGGGWAFNVQLRDSKGAKVESLKTKAE